jgi:Flp pilus assembly protein TadB
MISARILVVMGGLDTVEQRKPSPEAEQLWRSGEARFRRGIAMAALIAAVAIVLTWVWARLEVRSLAILCVIVILGTLAWTIYLIVRRQRVFTKIMTGDGLTRQEASREYLRRYGG